MVLNVQSVSHFNMCTFILFMTCTTCIGLHSGHEGFYSMHCFESPTIYRPAYVSVLLRQLTALLVYAVVPGDSTESPDNLEVYMAIF